jgi:hypothetical protein
MAAKKRRVRRGEPPPHDAALVVRGDVLDPEALRADATDNFEVYGYWGISTFVEIGAFDLAWIAANKLRRAGWLVVFRAGDVLTAGLELWDTGQSASLRCCARESRRTRHPPRGLSTSSHPKPS